MKACHLALVVLASVSTISVAAEPVVEIRLHGRYYTEPATVRVTVAVQPDQANRTLVVQADGERMFRSSEVSLEGDKSRRLHMLEFKNLQKGSYVLRAEVFSSAKLRGAAEQVLVVGEVGETR
jgi:hypothetical protein